MTVASQTWKTLDAGQQTDWESFAASHPIVNSLGQTVILSPSAMFCKVNIALLSNGSAVTLTPPLGLDAGGLSNITVTWTSGALSIVFAPTPSTLKMGVWATGIVSPGVTVPPGPGGWRKIGTIVPGASPSTQTTNWVAFFGSPPAADQVTFVKVCELVNGLWTSGMTRRVIAT